MIAPLRRRHRWTTAALAVALPVLYVVALAARPEPPAVERLPAELAPPLPGEVESDLGELLTDPAAEDLSLTLLSGADGSLIRRILELGEPGTVRVAYEAGPTGYGLYRACRAAGIPCLIAAPSKALSFRPSRFSRDWLS